MNELDKNLIFERSSSRQKKIITSKVQWNFRAVRATSWENPRTTLISELSLSRLNDRLQQDQRNLWTCQTGLSCGWILTSHEPHFRTEFNLKRRKEKQQSIYSLESIKNTYNPSTSRAPNATRPHAPCKRTFCHKAWKLKAAVTYTQRSNNGTKPYIASCRLKRRKLATSTNRTTQEQTHIVTYVRTAHLVEIFPAEVVTPDPVFSIHHQFVMLRWNCMPS